MAHKIVSADAAIAIIRDGDVVATSGYGVPELLLRTISRRFQETSSPRDLTLVHSTGQGDAVEKGLNHLAREGLVRRIIGGYYGLSGSN